VIFRRQYNSLSGKELGTIKCQANSLNRTNVNPDDSKTCDDNKDFLVLFYKAFIVVGLCTIQVLVTQMFAN
jgi:hypothetical protein